MKIMAKLLNYNNSSVISQKGESQGVKNTYQGVKNIRFLENMTCFVFLKHPFWDLPFCYITDEVRLPKH